MENNEVLTQLSAKVDALTAKIDDLTAKFNVIYATISGNSDLLSANGVQNNQTSPQLSASSAQNSASFALEDAVTASLQKEVRKEGKLDFRESVPAQLTRIMFYIRERKNASSGDIRLQFHLGEPTYRRYITFLRKWNWIELTPGAKKGNFVLSKKGKELMDKILAG